MAVVIKWKKSKGLCCLDKCRKRGEMGENKRARPVPCPNSDRVRHGRHSRRSGRSANAEGRMRGNVTAPLQRGFAGCMTAPLQWGEGGYDQLKVF